MNDYQVALINQLADQLRKERAAELERIKQENQEMRNQLYNLYSIYKPLQHAA